MAIAIIVFALTSCTRPPQLATLPALGQNQAYKWDEPATSFWDTHKKRPTTNIDVTGDMRTDNQDFNMLAPGYYVSNVCFKDMQIEMQARNKFYNNLNQFYNDYPNGDPTGYVGLILNISIRYNEREMEDGQIMTAQGWCIIEINGVAQ